MTTPRYSSPAAFKQALEQRLRDASKTGVDLNRRRQLLVFERFLARVEQTAGEPAVLKGGLVLELRLERSRTTKDVDLRMSGRPDELLTRLQRIGQLDLGDFMTFELQPDRHHPEIQGDGMKYDGYRFTTECRLAGKIYGSRFGVDVGFGDPMHGKPETIEGNRILDFAGIPPATVQLYPVASHLAEKLHAYTMPRRRPNSRIKDLPDIALLATTGALDATNLREAMAATFTFRDTHPLPEAVPTPPDAWAAPYERMAMLDGLPWPQLRDAHQAASAFLDPVLDQPPPTGTWDPTEWKWTED